ncbi:glycoside hydrolase family 19 protein [Streptomyces sp. DT24]|uniref:glycoside hydrolase family 19 protein n=1 Tax=unclassified Streptomyces TaxID=2593676 RepID=UPI0023B965FF|nr:glycoside hydrolase family 19 protein [Streptomyces sp. AM 4-1-1]WEH37429.1 chitinase [Streptomyces sp. AM 4-1-1]
MLRTRVKALLTGLMVAGSLVATALMPATASAATPVDECAIAGNWSKGANYQARDIVKYTDGKIYVAQRDNPGYDPTVSTYYWAPYTCGTGGNPTPNSFVVSEAQFDQMFPNRNPFYTYQGVVDAMKAFPKFAHTGTDAMRKQEAAAFLANISHETAGLYYIKEVNEANYPHYCDTDKPYGCPAGQSAYYGRGPIQLSWNFNYKQVGDFLGIDLLNNPWLVETDPAVSMMTALWYWNTQHGPGPITGHDAMVGGAGFGQTIRSINGALECDGKNPRQVESRVNRYKEFTRILGVPTGSAISC